MGLPVNPPDMKPAAVFCDETNGLTTTIVRKSVPGGASFIELGLFGSTGSAPTAKFLYVCFNALSDSEEAAMLANPSSRFCIPVGEVQKFLFEASDPCLRYAMATDAATESVGSKVVQRVGSLV